MRHDHQSDIDAVANVHAVPAILDVVCRTTGMGFAAVARVTEDRWIVCGVRDDIDFGLRPGGELRLETTICRDVRQAGTLVVIDNVAEDATFCDHPTPALYGFQSYISVPIVLPDGRFFGTLCAIDAKPARLNTPGTIGMFALFAEMIAFHLDANERLARSEASLLSERQASELREQFIAVLGHDLRNPLAAIDAGARMLQRTLLDAKAAEITGLMRSSIGRMSGLIDNVLDFARGRLGGGLALNRDAHRSLEPILRQVVDELQAAWPDRTIETDMTLSAPVHCDRVRVAQLFSNLLGNALTHGAPDGPIRVLAHTDEAFFYLSVANRGNRSHRRRWSACFSRSPGEPSKPTSRVSGSGYTSHRRWRGDTAARSTSHRPRKRPAFPSRCRLRKGRRRWVAPFQGAGAFNHLIEGTAAE